MMIRLVWASQKYANDVVFLDTDGSILQTGNELIVMGFGSKQGSPVSCPQKGVDKGLNPGCCSGRRRRYKNNANEDHIDVAAAVRIFVLESLCIMQIKAFDRYDDWYTIETKQ